MTKEKYLERSREWLVEWYGSIDDGWPSKEALESLADFAAAVAKEARVEEAKWGRQYWHDNDMVDGISPGHGGSIENCRMCTEYSQHVAELEQS